MFLKYPSGQFKVVGAELGKLEGTDEGEEEGADEGELTQKPPIDPSIKCSAPRGQVQLHDPAG